MNACAARGLAGISEPVWRVLLVGAVVALWFLVVLTGTARADDCLEYIKTVKNFVAIPRGLLEDCMRTGVAQAVLTGTIAGVGGAAIAAAVAKAIKDAAVKAGPGPHAVPNDTADDSDDSPQDSDDASAGDEPPPYPTATCPRCGTPYQDTGQSGKCPQCDAPVPGTCGSCGGTYYHDAAADGRCPHCRALLAPATATEPAVAQSGNEPATASGAAPTAGTPASDLGAGSPADPVGQATGPRPKLMDCPICGTGIPVGSAQCPGCRALVTPPVPTASAGGTGVGAGTGAGGGSGGAGAAPDPPFISQGVIRGDKAADLLQQAGLAKVTRDASGKPIKVEEAFPGAFTNLGGTTVTIKTGESGGGGSGPDWVEEAKGKITGIGFKPGPDGGLGEPAIVVDHSESQWRQLPPDPFAAAMQTAKDAATQAARVVTDAADEVKQEYQNLQTNAKLVDTARAAYNIAKVLEPQKADVAVRDLAKSLKIDPARAKEILSMDEKTWKGIQAGIDLPGTFLGN